MEQCNQILSQGIMNRIISNQQESIQKNFLEWFKKANYEDVKREMSAGFKFKFTVPIKGVPVPFDFGGSDAEQKFKQLKEHIEHGEVEEMSMSRTSEFLQENIDSEIVRTWENTMARILNHCSIIVDSNPHSPNPIPIPIPNPAPNPGIKYGLQYELDGSGETIAIKVYYIQTNSEDKYPVVESFRVIGGECIAGQLEPGALIDNEKTIIVKQTSIGEAILLISTNKQDLDIKFTSNILDSLLMKVFIYKLSIEPSHHIYTKKVPKGYRIVGGGFSLAFQRGEVGQPKCILTSSYPSALDEWTMKFTSKIEDNTVGSNQMVYLVLTAVYDPFNKLDIRIFKSENRRVTTVECSPEQGYLMIGGGVEFKILGGNNESELLNRENYRTGLTALYPKDDNTWEVRLNESDLQRIGSWDLVSYVIGIKKNGRIENYVRSKEHSTQVELNDGIFYVSSGGCISNSTSPNIYITNSTNNFNLQGSPTDQSIPNGWYSYPFRYDFFSPPDMSTFVIGIRQPGIQFLPLEGEF